jgi:hypothetical protein
VEVKLIFILVINISKCVYFYQELEN